MRYKVLLISIVALFVSGLGFSKIDWQSPTDGGPQKAIVDFEADVMKPIHFGDSVTALNLVGNVVFRHNGATINCDSAIRYDERRMECFGHVVINKDSTYIYGDRADYNGVENLATVYAPLIKLIDGDVTMYCFNMTFNTLTKIGVYTGGATISQKDNLMESQNGTYYADLRTVAFKGDVQMENKTYKIVTDSMTYNLDTEVTTFFTRAYIWTDKKDFLTARHGTYYRSVQTYVFQNDAYVLTEKQEIWADSLSYASQQEEVIMSRNIQVFDNERNSFLFGDYGHSWENGKRAIMTRNPAMLGVEVQQRRITPDSLETKSDTLFMRADTIYLYAVPPGQTYPKIAVDSTESEHPVMTDMRRKIDSLQHETMLPEHDTTLVDSAKNVRVEELKKDSLEYKPLSKRELKRQARELRRAEKLKLREEKARLREEKRTKKHPEKLDVVPPKIYDSLVAEKMKDSVLKLPYKLDSTVTTVDSSQQKTKPNKQQQDSLERIVQGFRHVKIFRSDFQAVCDSIVGRSVDSTMTMYVRPALWNEQSQICSEVINMYSKNEQIDRATFDGDPIMIEWVKDSLYNQVAGKYMEAFFRNNELYQLMVDGNAQTYYFMTDQDSTGRVDVMGFLVADCAKIRFEFANKTIDQIAYITDPAYTIYPLDKVPNTQPMRLKGFVWREDERPKNREEVFNRCVRPSQREEMSKIEKPKFPITKQIRSVRKSLKIM